MQTKKVFFFLSFFIIQIKYDQSFLNIEAIGLSSLIINEKIGGCSDGQMSNQCQVPESKGKYPKASIQIYLPVHLILFLQLCLSPMPHKKCTCAIFIDLILIDSC